MTPAPLQKSRVALFAMLLSLAIIPMNVVVYVLILENYRHEPSTWSALFTLLALGQLIAGIVALVSGIRNGRVPSAVLGTFAALGALVGWAGGFFVLIAGAMAGGAWGRPLRVRGRQLHPE